MRSRAKRSAAARAMAKCAPWTGSNVPPNMASLIGTRVGRPRKTIVCPTASWAPKLADRKKRWSAPRRTLPLDLHGIDAHFLLRPILRAARRLRYLANHVIAFSHLAEYGVAVVQPRGGGHGDEELAAVGVRPGVGHREDAGLRVL